MFSPAKVVFAAIGILLQVSILFDLLVPVIVTLLSTKTAKDVDASQEVLVDLFGRIENFFRRIESYTEVRPTAAMMDIIVKILVEVLSILAMATKEFGRGQASEWISSNSLLLTDSCLEKYLKKFTGKNDLEDALKKLDVLTQEEARMATAELLRVTRGIDDKVTTILDGAQSVFIQLFTLS